MSVLKSAGRHGVAALTSLSILVQQQYHSAVVNQTDCSSTGWNPSVATLWTLVYGSGSGGGLGSGSGSGTGAGPSSPPPSFV